jgi:ADP-ribosylglycohydrolase
MLSLIHNKGKLDPKDFAKRIETIFKEKRVVGYGSATMQAAQRLMNGVSWNKSGVGPPSAGNGSAMRAAPIGLAYWNVPAALIINTAYQGIITHDNPICSAGALIVSGAVALLLEHGNMGNWEKWYGYLAGYVASVSSELAHNMAELWVRRNDPMETVASWLHDMQIDDWPGISPWVKTSTLWSLYAFINSPDDFWETLCTAIWPGGDIDTTGAMAGAISGAYNGLQNIPHDVAILVNDKGRWGFEDLCGLAESLHRLVVNGHNSNGYSG